MKYTGSLFAVIQLPLIPMYFLLVLARACVMEVGSFVHIKWRTGLKGKYCGYKHQQYQTFHTTSVSVAFHSRFYNVQMIAPIVLDSLGMHGSHCYMEFHFLYAPVHVMVHAPVAIRCGGLECVCAGLF